MSSIDLSQAVDLGAVMAKSQEEKAKQLPKPQGYRIFVQFPKQKKPLKVVLLKPTKPVVMMNCLLTALFVVDLGPDCYQDKTRFPNGPWCKKGDFILVRPNAGTRLVIHDREFRIINDDSVEAVVDDPRGIKRKFI